MFEKEIPPQSLLSLRFGIQFLAAIFDDAEISDGRVISTKKNIPNLPFLQCVTNTAWKFIYTVTHPESGQTTLKAGELF